MWYSCGCCCQGAVLAGGGWPSLSYSLYSLPCFLLSFFSASPSLLTFYMWRALFPLPRPAPQSMPCFGHCPLASSAFPCLVGRSIELVCPMAGCCRRWRLLPAGMAVWRLLPLPPGPLLVFFLIPYRGWAPFLSIASWWLVCSQHDWAEGVRRWGS